MRRIIAPSGDINIQLAARRAAKARRCSTGPRRLEAWRAPRTSMTCETGMLELPFIHGKYALSQNDTLGQDRAGGLQRVELTS